jgi:hypothetical protein
MEPYISSQTSNPSNLDKTIDKILEHSEASFDRSIWIQNMRYLELETWIIQMEKVSLVWKDFRTQHCFIDCSTNKLYIQQLQILAEKEWSL